MLDIVVKLLLLFLCCAFIHVKLSNAYNRLIAPTNTADSSVNGTPFIHSLSTYVPSSFQDFEQLHTACWCVASCCLPHETRTSYGYITSGTIYHPSPGRAPPLSPFDVQLLQKIAAKIGHISVRFSMRTSLYPLLPRPMHYP